MEVKMFSIRFPRKKLGKCDVIVKVSNDNMAHFHLRNKRYDIKIGIFMPLYIGGKSEYELDEDDMDILAKAMRKKKGVIYRKTQWERVALKWKELNDDVSDYLEKDRIITDKLRPFYTDLKYVETIVIFKVEFPTELGKCDISIKSTNENTAYFHLENDKHDIKICLFKPEYHGENDYILNDIEKKILNDEMSSRFDSVSGGNISQWTMLAFMWDDENGDFSNYPEKSYKSIAGLQPNYNELKEV